MLVPSIPQIPDVGGPTLTPIPAPSIYIGGLPAAKIGDKLVVVGPQSSIIATPSVGPSSVPSTE